MKYCTKCGNQLTDEMAFCQKCGTKNESVNTITDIMEFEPDNFQKSHNTTENPEQPEILQNQKLRTSMKVWMIIFFVFTGIFAIGSTDDASMIAGVCLFGILGVMFLILAKTPKGAIKMFTNSKLFKKTQGISKGAFVGISVFLALFLFIGIINISTTSSTSEYETTAKKSVTENEQKEIKKETANTSKIPPEFSEECPVSVTVSMYDNIIGLPELRCNIKNKTNMEIAAIQFYFLPKDVYGEKVDGIFTQNKLQFDTPLPANSSDNVEWQMVDQDIKSGDLYVYSVYFSDGTEWGDRNAPSSKIKKYALKTQVSY